jgi:hypothetical protein
LRGLSSGRVACCSLSAVVARLKGAKALPLPPSPRRLTDLRPPLFWRPVPRRAMSGDGKPLRSAALKTLAA